MESIDALFLFWCGLTCAVYIVGGLIERQKAAQLKTLTSYAARRQSIQAWPSASNDLPSTSSSASAFEHSSSKVTAPTTTASSYSNAHFNTTSAYQNRQLADHEPKTRLTSFNQQSIGNQNFNEALTSNQATWSSDDEAGGHRLTGPQSIPTATGYNADCVSWINSILFLFYTERDRYAPIIGDSLIRSLNEKASSLLANGMDQHQQATTSNGTTSIEFLSINRARSCMPELTNIRTENESDKSVCVNCKLYNQSLLIDFAIRRRSSELGFTNQLEESYELLLENLEGRLKVVAMFNDRLIVAQFADRPDTKISLQMKQRAGELNQSLINMDSLVSLILETLRQVVVDLYFGDDADFPQYLANSSGLRNKLSQLKGSATELKRQLKQDFLGALNLSPMNLVESRQQLERKLVVKLMMAKNINYNQNVVCLLELDSPQQLAFSSTRSGSNPQWDEHFLFNIEDKSRELVLELWDSRATQALDSSATSSNSRRAEQVRASGKSLGQVRILVEELYRKPIQRVNLNLEPASRSGSRLPAGVELISNGVGGELSLELLFLEHSAASSRSPSPLARSNSINSINQQAQQLTGDVVAVDRKLTQSGFVITTTTITKAKGSTLPHSMTTAARGHNQAHPPPPPPPPPPLILSAAPGRMSPSSQTELSDLQSEQLGHLDGQSEGRASRARSRSRSLLRAIKRKFSFSRNRSRSLSHSAPNSPPPGSPSGLEQRRRLGDDSLAGLSRASSEVSMEPASSGANSRARSMPSSRDPNEVPTIVINKTRLSDTQSAYSFAHPKSQLVIEVHEPILGDGLEARGKTRARYYAIAEDARDKDKWRKRGTKLHLFNEHQFVAAHLAGSSTCHLCGKVFSRRPGKQGYKCRNCHLLSHKQCHVKVDHNCPYAKHEELKLEFIDADPPANLVRSATSQSTSTLARQKRQMLATKSVSMDDR